MDGVITGCILSVGRILGESAALLFTAGFAHTLRPLFEGIRAVGLEGEELRLKLIVAAGGPDQIDGAALVGAVAVGFHISR